MSSRKNLSRDEKQILFEIINKLKHKSILTNKKTKMNTWEKILLSLNHK